uniref:Uncharacterized protein n=1 Tax=Melopsittacus undulatus TaxID=13146 RepID=A0A8V5FN18_MELUD
MKSVRGLLAASVISIQNSCFIYPACQNCFSRLILDSRRFNCPKCGCTGEAKDASYRYRLSLKIADTNDLFDITVFGSCLDPFFGLSGETNTDVSQAVLFQAVETCFIGKRFIFGVKGWAREDGGHPAASSILQNCSRINRSTKTLTACQLFLPNAAVTGFTVISYFHRLLQSAKLRSCSNSSDLPDTSAAAADEAVSELSSLSSLSRNSCSVQPSGRESPLRSWQESLSLTSSVAWVTAEDFPTLEVGKLASEQHEQEGRPVPAESCSVSLNSQTPWDSPFCSSSDSTSATDELERISSSECSHGTSSRLFQHPLESEVQSAYPKTDGRNYSCPEKSHNSLLSKKDASASSHINVTGVSQMDSMLWDELAFSESLNEFLARIEEGKSITSSPNLDAGKHPERSRLGANPDKSCLRQTLVAADLPEASVSRKVLPPANSDSWENVLFACLQSHAHPQSDAVSQRESSSSVLSDKESCFIPNPHLPILSQSLPVTTEPSVSESRYVQSKAANTDISKSSWSFLNHCAAKHGETCLKRSEAAPCVHSVHGSCLAGWENKENSSSTPSQRAEVSENTFKSVNRRETLWNSIFPEGSYDASADLFDARERKSCHSLIKGDDTLTDKVTTPELVLHFPRAFRKHSTPVTSSFCNAQCSSVSAQDFVPYSQSTPMAKPLQKLWPVGERSSFVTVFTPTNPRKIHSKCKRSRSAFQNTLLQQLTGQLVKCERPSNSEDKESNSSVSQQFLNSQLPASCEEWVSPANKKVEAICIFTVKSSWAGS